MTLVPTSKGTSISIGLAGNDRRPGGRADRHRPGSAVKAVVHICWNWSLRPRGRCIPDHMGSISGIDMSRYPDFWDLIGGHIEPGETATDAIHRECREELAITIRHPRPIEIPFEPPEVILHGFLITTWDGEPVNAEPEEHIGTGCSSETIVLVVPGHPVNRRSGRRYLRYEIRFRP